MLDNWDIKEHHSSNYTVLTGAYFISTISMMISRHTITCIRTQCVVTNWYRQVASSVGATLIDIWDKIIYNWECVWRAQSQVSLPDTSSQKVFVSHMVQDYYHDWLSTQTVTYGDKPSTHKKIFVLLLTFFIFHIKRIYFWFTSEKCF